MNRSQVTPSQLRLTYALGLFILVLLFTSDLVNTRAKILNDVEVGLINGTYILAELIGDEPIVSNETVIEFLENIRLEPLTQITVMDTTFNVIAEFSEDNSPRHIRLSESGLIVLMASSRTFALETCYQQFAIYVFLMVLDAVAG